MTWAEKYSTIQLQDIESPKGGHDMTKREQEQMRELRKDKKILVRTHGSVSDIPLWEIQSLINEYPAISAVKIYRMFGR